MKIIFDDFEPLKEDFYFGLVPPSMFAVVGSPIALITVLTPSEPIEHALKTSVWGQNDETKLSPPIGLEMRVGMFINGIYEVPQIRNIVCEMM